MAVTGASSFLGSSLIGLLEEDPTIDRLVALDITPPATAGPKTRTYEVDLTLPSSSARLAEIFAAEQVRTVVHLAFFASPSASSAYAHELESVGTMHLSVASRQARIQKFILWSQTALYGATPANPNFLTEDHPLRAPASEAFFSNKIEAEAEIARLADREPSSTVTVLRTCPMLGPTVRNYVTRYLSRRIVPVLMGFDPLLQVVHEVDALRAFHLAVRTDVPGIFNIVGEGVLPLSTIIRLAGRIALPVPHPLARPLTRASWLAQLSFAPPSFLSFLRYVSVADGTRASEVLGFRPAYTTREAVLDFASAEHLREARLLEERP